MKDRKLAIRYARALLASLPGSQAAEEADGFLDALRESLEAADGFRDLLYDPAIARATRREILCSLAQRAGMPIQVAHFLATLVDHNRLTSLPSIARVFHEEREAAAGILRAEITTAGPLDADLERQAQQVLEQLTGRRVRLTTRTDPAIVGGAVTKVGSTLYDGSLRTQLEDLRRKMLQE